MAGSTKTPRDFETALADANGRLRSGKVGVTLRVKRGRIYLRATLPPRPDSDSALWRQSDLAPNPPVPATLFGIPSAERLARIVAGQILSGQFNWADWVRQQKPSAAPSLSSGSSAPLTNAVLIKEFEEFFLIKNNGDAQRQGTWRSFCWRLLQLPQDDSPTVESLLELALKYPEDSASRKKAADVIQQYGVFCGLEMPKVKATYSRRSVSVRSLPIDEDIAEFRNSIERRELRDSLSLIATYGLRPSELWDIDPRSLQSGNGWILILDSKTRESREVPPILPEWYEKWDLANAQVLPTQAKIRGVKPIRLRQLLNDLEMPFKLYDLRHAWAVRAIYFGLKDQTAAAAMGHSVDEHRKTYQRWLRISDLKDDFEKCRNQRQKD